MNGTRGRKSGSLLPPVTNLHNMEQNKQINANKPIMLKAAKSKSTIKKTEDGVLVLKLVLFLFLLACTYKSINLHLQIYKFSEAQIIGCSSVCRLYYPLPNKSRFDS